MKKLILSVLLVAGITALVPKAEACDQRRAVLYYNECGQPVYGYINDDDDNYGYRSRYVSYNSGHYDNYRSRYYQPRYEYPRHHSVGFSFVFGR